MDIITEFRAHFESLSEYKISNREPYCNHYEFRFANLTMYVPSDCFTAIDVLRHIIRQMQIGIGSNLIYIVISGKTNIDFTNAPNCVITIHHAGILKKTVRCKIVSNRCCDNKSFQYLDYDIMYADEFFSKKHNAIKVIESIKFDHLACHDNLYNGQVLYVYLQHNWHTRDGNYYYGHDHVYENAYDHNFINNYFGKYNILCIIHSTTIIVNRNHILSEDLIEYMYANGYIDNVNNYAYAIIHGIIDCYYTKYTSKEYVVYTCDNSYKFFINVDIKAEPLMKNANK